MEAIDLRVLNSEKAKQSPKVEVTAEEFHTFREWARDNVEGFYGESAMISDRMNYFNEDNKVIAYISVYFTNNYFINEDYLSQMREASK